MLHVGYLDLGTDATYGTADDRWVRAVDGNFGGTPNFLGNQPYSAGYFSLGNYGVDTANQVVWAVVNHNSQFAAVPEPGTLALLAAGAIGLLTAVRRSKRASHLTCVVAVLLLLPGLARADVFNMAGGLTSLQFVSVDDAGNQADGSGYGAVGYNYRMGKYDVTAAQYTAFLNAVAATDTYGLYSPGQGADLPTIGISRSGSSGSYTYAVIGNGDVPVFDVSWGNAARFANWLHNGQPAGAQGPTTTESGAYELSGGTNTAALMAVTRSATASYFIPSEDEWYKAAYYKSGGTAAGYWTYPTMSNLAPSNVLLLSGSNHANFYSGGYTDPVNFFTSVGAFAASPGPYGTYDMGGDVFQWNEAAVTGSSRGMRGGAYDTVAVTLSSAFRDDGNPASVFTRTGFRVASIEPVPEPGSITLLLAAAVGLLIRRTRRRWKLS
jgi:formylglycine-generating enzyme required for sulfatase activity